MDFSERFSEIRRLRSFSYETLSEFSGISKTTIYKLEKKNSVPSLSTLSKLSSVLKCDLINLYRLSEQEYLAEFEQLRCKIESDFSMRDYSRLQEYIHELDGLYSSIVYKGGDIQKDIYFESLEKTYDWLKSVEYYICDNDIKKAVDNFENSIIPVNSEFTYMDYLNNNVMTLLDINTNCTYTALKFLSGENQELELLYNFLFKRQEEEYTTFENHSYFLSIFLRVGYNYLSLLLDKNLYREVIETSYSFLELITRYRIGGEKYQFLLIKSVAHFQLYNEKDINLQNLKLILEIDDKLHLYDSICAALKLYDIYI